MRDMATVAMCLIVLNCPCAAVHLRAAIQPSTGVADALIHVASTGSGQSSLVEPAMLNPSKIVPHITTHGSGQSSPTKIVPHIMTHGSGQSSPIEPANLHPSQVSQENVVVTKEFCESVLRGIQCKQPPYFDISTGKFLPETRTSLVQQCAVRVCDWSKWFNQLAVDEDSPVQHVPQCNDPTNYMKNMLNGTPDADSLLTIINIAAIMQRHGKGVDNKYPSFLAPNCTKTSATLSLTKNDEEEEEEEEGEETDGHIIKNIIKTGEEEEEDTNTGGEEEEEEAEPVKTCFATSTSSHDGSDGNFYCINGGTVGGTTSSCTCTSCGTGYSGNSCEIADCVPTTTSSHDGSDRPDGKFYCINGGKIGGTTGSCTCSACDAGYSGDSCETPDNCVLTTTSSDDGSDGKFYCINGGTIGGTTGSCTCTSCNTHYRGNSCETFHPPGFPITNNDSEGGGQGGNNGHRFVDVAAHTSVLTDKTGEM